MSSSNPRWGGERIRGELLKIGIRISKRTAMADRPAVSRVVALDAFRGFVKLRQVLKNAAVGSMLWAP